MGAHPVSPKGRTCPYSAALGGGVGPLTTDERPSRRTCLGGQQTPLTYQDDRSMTPGQSSGTLSGVTSHGGG